MRARGFAQSWRGQWDPWMVMAIESCLGLGSTPAALQSSLLQGPFSPICSAPQLGWTCCLLRHLVWKMTDLLGHMGSGRVEHRLCPGPPLRFLGVLGWD